jgi:hypothetical protein
MEDHKNNNNNNNNNILNSNSQQLLLKNKKIKIINSEIKVNSITNKKEININTNTNNNTQTNGNKNININTNPNINNNKDSNNNNNNVNESNDKKNLISEIISQKKILLSHLVLFKEYPLFFSAKTSENSFGSIGSYAVNSYIGKVKKTNEDRISIIQNVIKPPSRKIEEWPKVDFFAIYDGHEGTKCSDFLKENLHHYVCMNFFKIKSFV